MKNTPWRNFKISTRKDKSLTDYYNFRHEPVKMKLGKLSYRFDREEPHEDVARDGEFGC
jgi:hypothetical protein